jgi:hypothetical protein
MHEPDSRYQERKKNEELVMLHRSDPKEWFLLLSRHVDPITIA